VARKRRFGISLREDLAKRLDAICSAMNVSRSSFIQDAIEFGIRAHLHYTVEHNCEGVMIAIWHSSDRSSAEMEKVLEKYKNLVSFNTHLHSQDKCVLIVALKGLSNTIAKLHTELKRAGSASVMYIPFNLMNGRTGDIRADRLS